HDMPSPLRRFTTGVFAEAGDRVPWNQPPPHDEAPSGGGLQATSATSAGRHRLGQPAPATSGSRNSWNSDRLSSEPFLKSCSGGGAVCRIGDTPSWVDVVKVQGVVMKKLLCVVVAVALVVVLPLAAVADTRNVYADCGSSSPGGSFLSTGRALNYQKHSKSG